MIRCACCGGLKRHSELNVTWDEIDKTGRVIQTVGLCKACQDEHHERFQEDLKDPESQASRMLREIMVEVAKRGPTRLDA